jgi:Zn-finger nucleic acid-binding protein
MKAKAKASSAKQLQFELKYCERCGGLWLRPVGGGQIYCRTCGREMAQLPPASKEPETANVPRGPRWGVDDVDVEGYEEDEGVDLDAAAGVA